jgi:hypothetical protein
VSRAAAAVRSRAPVLPVWAWPALLVGVSAAVQLVLARRVVAPWIMIDELVYSELAKSLAAHGHFLIRGVPSSGYGFVYPILIAPAWRLFASVPAAYDAARAINAVVMSLTVVPVYQLARRLVGQVPALGAAALTVLVPSMLYTGMVMTENVFYPVFAWACLALVRALERPSVRRQVELLAVCALAYAARAQAVALLPAAAVAPVLLGVLERDLRRLLRAFLPLYGALVAGALVVLAATAARGRSPLVLLGAYRAVTGKSYSVVETARYLLWHVGELDLSLAVIPFAALLALWLSARALPPAGRVFAAASLPVCVFLLVEVAAFAATESLRIEERNMFYLAPLAFVSLFALGAGVVPRRRGVLAAAALAACVLPALVPYDRFIATPAMSDTFGLLPWWWLLDHLVPPADLRWAVLGASAAAVCLLAVRGRAVIVLPLVVAAYLVVSTADVANSAQGVRANSIGSLWAGIKVPHRDWIDRAVGHHADVSVLVSQQVPPGAVWENEFFSRSVRTVFTVGGAIPGDLAETPLHEVAKGRLADAGGRVVAARYALAATTSDVEGRIVASDPKEGLSLVRVDGPLVLQTHVAGLYADDWGGRRVTYTRYDCTGGRLAVVLQSDPHLYTREQVVTATSAGRNVGVARVPPIGERRLTVLLLPDASRTCRITFTAARVLVPARVQPGSSDTRELGARFLSFEYRP